MQYLKDPQPRSLPCEVLEKVAALLDPTSRGVARHVNREFRVAVRVVREAEGEDEGGVDRGHRMRASALCRSLDLAQWSRAQGCSWSLEQWMAKAAGDGRV
jgi:hypothetical protein